MNRENLVNAFAAAALALTGLYVINRYGYSSVKAIIFLAVLAVIGAFAAGLSSSVAVALVLLIFFVVDHVIADRFMSAGIVAVIALAAVLAQNNKNIWRR